LISNISQVCEVKMKFTSEEIALCKKLHELGVRRKIKEGDWYILPSDSLTGTIPRLFDARSIAHELWEFEINKEGTPLWTWADAREWLREKGYWLLKHFDHANDLVKNTVKIIDAKTIYDLIHKGFIEQSGDSDLEAILKCMVEIAEKGGKG